MIQEYIRKLEKTSYNPTFILVIGFIVVILCGTFLLSLPAASRSSQWTPLLPSLFTATSATCVTGLVLHDTYTHWSTFGHIILMILMQIGGLGFMTFAAAAGLIMGKRLTLKQRLIMVQSLNIVEIEGIVKLTKHICIGTFVLEFIGMLLFATVYVPEFGFSNGLFKSLFHSVSAFCNSGMDLMGEREPFSSLTAYRTNIIINFTTIALLISGGIGFFVWEDLYRNYKRGFHKLEIYSKVVILSTVILILSGTILFFVLEYHNPSTLGNVPLGEKCLLSLFQTASARTAGFNTIDLNGLKEETILVMMVLMFIGGASGSTAGGLKVGTATVLVLAVFGAVQGKKEVVIWGRKISDDSVLRALTITIISMFLIAVTTMVLLLTAKSAFIPVLFESMSAYGTVGLSMGITTSLNNVGLITLIIMMFFGRLGVFTIGLALALKFKTNSEILKYPETKFTIG